MLEGLFRIRPRTVPPLRIPFHAAPGLCRRLARMTRQPAGMAAWTVWVGLALIAAGGDLMAAGAGATALQRTALESAGPTVAAWLFVTQFGDQVASHRERTLIQATTVI